MTINNKHSLTHKRFDHADHAVENGRDLLETNIYISSSESQMSSPGSSSQEVSDLATATEPLPRGLEGSGCTRHGEGRLGFGFSSTLSWEVTMEG